jgi:colanic acid/amylovoran biosynthesis glycosyltransferase
MRGDGKTLLIFAPVPLHRKAGQFYLEDQARNGLRLWVENFDRLILMLPLTDGPMPASWGPLSLTGPALERVTVEPLPMAYRPDMFFRELPSVRRRIRSLINQADYLSFAIGGLFGDWGSVACLEAYRMGRPYAVWTDRVESEVTRRMIGQGSWRQSLRARLYHRPMAMLERHVIRRARVGFFHGHETYTAYSPFCRNPQTVHDIHISKTDHIGSGQLEAKASDVAGRARPLRIVYVGRADPMKGPFDWLATLEALQQAGVDFEAKWIGDGSEYAAMKGRIDSSGLRGRVSLPGFASDRKEVLESLRHADIFLFCHKTPESPRCLIEALISGTPIVGYGGAFASDLIKEHGGGVLVERDNVAALSREVIGLSGNPGRLAKLIAKAAADGEPFDDVSVFRHRAELIREHLPLR